MDVFTRAARYFDEVAKQGSIRRAAKQLNLAPSAVNRHVLDLERDIGVQLFERTSKGLRLTTAGEIFTHRLRFWRSDFSRTREMIDGLQGLRSGRIRLCCVEGLVTYVVPMALARFQRKYPGIQVDVAVQSSDAVVKSLQEGESEVGITFNPPATRTLRRAISVACQIGIVVAANHPLAGQSHARLSELDGIPIALPSEDISLRQVIQIGEEALSINLATSIQTNSIGLLKTLVLQNGCVTILNNIDVMDETRSGALVHIPLSDKVFAEQTMVVLTHAMRTRSAAVDAFINFVQELVDEMTRQKTDD